MRPAPRFLAHINLKINQKLYASAIYKKTRSPRSGLNRWPLPYQGSAPPLSYVGAKKLIRLTKKVERETGLEPATLSLEGWRSSQLSYSRKFNQPQNSGWGGEDSNLRRLSRQIYSLFPLATREPPRNFGKNATFKSRSNIQPYPPTQGARILFKPIS